MDRIVAAHRLLASRRSKIGSPAEGRTHRCARARQGVWLSALWHFPPAANRSPGKRRESAGLDLRRRTIIHASNDPGNTLDATKDLRKLHPSSL